ncbi:MAG: hypothetical protein QOF48_3296 [Verrucomicrobiota bacterium]|jgi:hypothetical protein
MLTQWSFQDDKANSTTPQINRQKSSRNLEVIQFDRSEPRGVFADPRNNIKHTATLTRCDCADFNFAGEHPRKVFKPCMHIYRLAIELGLLEAKYFDYRARFRMAGILSREETARLQKLPPDVAQWGNWNAEVHASGIQRNRQYRAYAIVNEEDNAISIVDKVWRIHGYKVRLDLCECMDFCDRRLPCKHIYAVALASELALRFGRNDYDAARKQGIEIVFEFPASAQ